MSQPKFALIFIVLLLASLPLAGLATVMIFPFWNWFEKATGIESFGHSGPANWRYLFDYVVVASLSIYVLFKRYRHAKENK